MIFREAVPADVPALVALISAAYRGPERGWTSEADLIDDERIDAAGVTRLLAPPSSIVLVALEDESLAGCCHIRDEGSGRAHIGLLSVRPALQARGVGRALMARTEELARRRWGASEMRLRVIELRSELVQWYERLGYARTGEREPFPSGEHPELEFVVLHKRLAA